MRALLFFLLLGFMAPLVGQNMNNIRLDSIFNALTEEVKGQAGQWELLVGETSMLCITDETHDRMRIISPVKSIDAATPAEIMACMEANFHTALDVKYAIADDIMWVAFIHPLSPLTDGQVVDALTQVRAAVITYGTIYTSTDLVFPKREGETEEQEPPNQRTKRL